ncbi:TetR family transcriptional regulator [Pseudomonas sp. CCM 7891]|uniref:TetR family transcriptional regulator n=1 Tax=Pseudomonas karstica TaxID=1055468 RepID=A0A7X2UYP5_9PSED|nr:TetR/AcrR family transcriptional regulator [Pseudomonas karstica]MTD19317.1 TetR family transcriptional regulator [Pseudomonas karstica]
MTFSQLDAPSYHSAETILSCASALIVQIGYGAMSMRCLARQMGLQAGSLYYHFENKAAVLEQVVENVIGRRCDAWRQAKPKRATPLGLLERFVHFHVRYQFAFGAEEKSVLTEMRHLASERQAALAKEIAAYVDEVAGIVAKCRAKSADTEDVRITAASLIALLDGARQLRTSDAVRSDAHLVQVMYKLSLQLLNLHPLTAVSLATSSSAIATKTLARPVQRGSPVQDPFCAPSEVQCSITGTQDKKDKPHRPL